MERGVCYFSLGRSHLARLAVSLWSLRKYYSGPVTILSAGGDGGVLDRFTADRRAEVSIRPIGIWRMRRNAAYVAKAGLWLHSPFRVSLLLDSDTVVFRDPTPLLEAAESGESGMVLTSFSFWSTATPIIRHRLHRWQEVAAARDLAARALAGRFPAINTGVVAWRRHVPFLPIWKSLTEAGRHLPLTDELAAQVALAEQPATIMPEEWNWSPIHGVAESPAIAHFHGGKHLERPDGRGREGAAWWLPAYEEARGEKFAGLPEWQPAGDPRLAEHLARTGAAG